MQLKKSCEVCSEPTVKKPSHSVAAWERVRFCSRACYSKWWVSSVMRRAQQAKPVLRGAAHPMFGKKQSAEARAGMSRNHGTAPRHTTHHAEETKQRISRNRRGKALGAGNPNWRGGVTPENARLRHSPECFDWRRAVFERDNFTCQHCGQRGGLINAHHKKSWARHPELRFDASNGETLCDVCHREEHKLSYP